MSTCQICGREIKTREGFIAHHGYRRPYTGLQTRSCEGTNNRPYEISCGRIPRAIENRLQFIAATEAKLAEEPPATISWNAPGYGGYAKRLDRPEGFIFDRRTAWARGSYGYAYAQQRNAWAGDITAARQDIEYLRNRLAAWKAAA